MKYALNLILKRWTRRRQKAWAERLVKRITPSLPRGVTCHHRGWFPGCEPLTEWRELEWVELEVSLGEGASISHRYTYPDEPNHDAVVIDGRRLLLQRSTPALPRVAGEGDEA